MATKKLRATLPGEIYKPKERWWWKVRLPGESRIRERSLRPKGERLGTKTRRVAEEIALDMWQEALCENACLEWEDRYNDHTQLKATIHSRVYGLSHDRASRPTQPAQTYELPSSSPSLPVEDIFEAIRGEMLDRVVSDAQDQARCECCGCSDFYEEYLHEIDSGQSLCPRCLREFHEKVRQLSQGVTIPS